MEWNPRVASKLLQLKFFREMFGYATELRSMTKEELVTQWNLNVIAKFRKRSRSSCCEEIVAINYIE